MNILPFIQIYVKLIILIDSTIKAHFSNIKNMILRLLRIQIKYIFCLIILTVGVLTISNAQNSDIQFDHYTVEDGLSQNSVYSILQDSQGLMWFGTRTGGLNKFNGYSFTSYKKNMLDSLSISGNEILSLCEDKHGMIWVGTRNEGVNRFDKETNTFYSYFPDSNDSTSISSKTTTCIYEDKKGDLWFGTNYGLCMYNRQNDNFIWHADKNEIKSIHIKTLISGGKNLLWIGSRNGLYLYNTQSREIIKYFYHDKNEQTSLSSSYIMALTIDVNGCIWAGTYKDGLNRLDDIDSGKFTRFKNNKKNKNSLANNIIRTLHLDKKGMLWIGTKQALDKVKPEQQDATAPIFIHHKKDDNNPYSLTHNSIFSFYEGADDNLWVGTYIGGVNQAFNGNPKFKSVTRKRNNSNSLSNNVVNYITENDKGLWIGTEGGGLNLYNPKSGSYEVFSMNSDNNRGLENNHIKSLHFDGDGDLWIGSFDGLYLYNKKINKFRNFIEGIDVYSISEGRPGEIWVGTNNNLFILSKSDYSIIEVKANSNDMGMNSTDIIKIFKDKKERIWIGTKTGLYKYNRKQNKFIQYKHNKLDKFSLSNSHCTCINEDEEGNIWIGTQDGLNCYNEKTEIFEHFGEIAGLPDNVISNLLFDDAGNLWLTTNKGLSKIDMKEFLNNDELSNSTKKNNVRNYDMDDGLQYLEFRLNSSFKNKEGKLFFGSIRGFNYFHPDSIKDNPHSPKLILTSFKLFNKEVVPNVKNSPLTKPIGYTRSISLNHKQSVISFQFAALNFRSPHKNQYAYMLEGYDKDWNYIGTKHEATYTSLPAGNYIFKIKGSNNDCIWNDAGTSLELRITPPFWKKLWFQAASILLTISLIVIYYISRISKEKKINRLLELKVLERTTEISNKNNLLLEQSEILNKSYSTLEEKQQLILKQTDKIIDQRDKLAEANEVKDKLFSVISHDLRSPFQAVLGLSRLLANNYKEYDDDKRLIYVNQIFESSTIIYNLIDSLLLWSRSQMNNITTTYTSININKIINDNISLAEIQAKEKNIQINSSFQNEEIIISLDKDLISTVIRNLISNAIKFTKIDGEINISCIANPNNVIVCVKDNGVGISKEAQSKIFSKNNQNISYGTNNEKGTGLGLQICQDFIKLHHGTFCLNSEVDIGSEFSFSLPRLH